MTVPVVAVFRAKPGQEARVEELFRSVIAPTHAEEGCIAYQLNRDAADPARFVWTEEWESRELLDRHLTAPHILRLFNEQLPGLIESQDVIPLTPIAGMR